MSFVKSFCRFWYDFIVGDDWRLAVAVVVLVPAVALLSGNGINAWWLLPVGVATLLAVSIGHVARAAPRG